MSSDRTLGAVLQSTSDCLFPADLGERPVDIDSRGGDGDTPLHVLLWRDDVDGRCFSSGTERTSMQLETWEKRRCTSRCAKANLVLLPPYSPQEHPRKSFQSLVKPRISLPMSAESIYLGPNPAFNRTRRYAASLLIARRWRRASSLHSSHLVSL